MTGEPALVIVTGPPASGKTTIARGLSEKLEIPAFYKDRFKERLAEDLLGEGLAWSRSLGGVSYALLFEVAGVLLGSGTPCLIEANFHPELSLPDLSRLARSGRPIQVVCHANEAELERRYLARHDDGARHPVHIDWELAGSAYLAEAFRRDHTLRLPGEVIPVDTTDWESVDIERIVERVRALVSYAPRRSR